MKEICIFLVSFTQSSSMVTSCKPKVHPITTGILTLVQSNTEHFHHFGGSLMLPFYILFHFPPGPYPLTTTNLFSTSIILYISRTLHKWNDTVCNLLILAFFTCKFLKTHAGCMLHVSIVCSFNLEYCSMVWMCLFV